MSFVRGIVALLLTISVLVFAIANRHVVSVFWSPFHPSFEFPLYLVALGLMAFGFIFGAVLVWLNESALRRDRKKQTRLVKNLEKELKFVNENQAIATPSSEFFPALSAAKK